MATLNQSIMIQNKIVKPIEIVLFSENDTDINGEFRDPLEIFVKRFDENEKEGYICRKISRDDGLIHYLNKKPAKIEEIDVTHKIMRKLRMLICVTVFDESERKLTSTLEGIYDNLVDFCSNEISPEDIAVVVMADGIQYLDKTMLEFFERLDTEMGLPQLTISSRLSKITEESTKYIDEAKSELDRLKRRNEVDTNMYFPSSIQKKTAICYQARCSAKDFPHVRALGGPYSEVKLNIFFTVKMTNNGKLSSHMWFFQGFCKLFNPDYCTILECGTRPDKSGLFNFFRALESDKDLGAVCGYLGGRDYDIEYKKLKQLPFKFEYDSNDNFLMKIMPFFMNKLLLLINFFINIIENIFSLQKAQQFEYAWENIYNKSFQSLFGYVPVLPSAWSAYRWDALAEDNLLEKEYLLTVKNPDYIYKSIKEANKILTEDRLLSLAIFTKRNRSFYIKYCPDARAEMELIETVPELLTQRKRIINGGWYAIEHIIYYNNQIRFSKHTNTSKLMFSFVVSMTKTSLMILYFMPTFYYVALKILMFAYMDQISLVDNPASSLAGFWLYFFISMMITLIFISLLFKSIDKDMVFFFRLIAHTLGIFMLFTFVVLIIILIREVFSYNSEYFIHEPILIQILVLIIIGSLACVALFNPFAWKHLFFGAIHYLYYLPTYAHITTVYAFCRIDDLSWGIRGAHIKAPATQMKEFKDFKVDFVSTWLLVNTIVSYIIIVVTSSTTNQGGFLTMILILIAFFTGVKALFACLYALKYCLFDQKEHYEKIKELKPYYMKGRLEIEKYYDKIKFNAGGMMTGADNSEGPGLRGNTNNNFDMNGGFENSMLLINSLTNVNVPANATNRNQIQGGNAFSVFGQKRESLAL